MPENGSGNDIDHLQISIEANAAKAAMGIERLALALGTLKTSTSGVSEMLSGIVDSLQKLSQTNNISVKVKAFEKIGTTGANSAKRATTNFSALSRVLSTLAKPFNKAAAAAGSFLKKLGSRVIHAFTGRIERLATGVHRLFNSIRRVVLMRAISAVLREITAGFKEGIDNLYQWSALVDGRFKASMDKIATSMLYLKNSLAAMVSPIINKLAPAIDWLVDRFVDLLNIVNQVFSALTGSNTWTKAIKYPVEYAEGMADAAKSTKEAAKELKLFLLPFDELNVLTKDNPADTSTPGGAGQGGLNYAEMFETRELEDWAKKIKDLIDQGDWYGAGAALAEHLNGIIERWDSEAWGKELAAKLNNGIQFALGLMRNFGWELLGDKIGGFLNGFTLDFDWESFGALLATPVNSVSAFLKGMFKRFNGTEFGKGLGKLFNGWVKEMNVQDIVAAIQLGIEDATQIVKAFFDTADPVELANKISDILCGMDWNKIWTEVWEVAKSALKFTWHLGETLLDNLWNGRTEEYTDEQGRTVTVNKNGNKGLVVGGGILGAGALGLAGIGGLLGLVGKLLPLIKLFTGGGTAGSILSKVFTTAGIKTGAEAAGTGALSGAAGTAAIAAGGTLAYAMALLGINKLGDKLGTAGIDQLSRGDHTFGFSNLLAGLGIKIGQGGFLGTQGGLQGAGVGGAAGYSLGALMFALETIRDHFKGVKEASDDADSGIGNFFSTIFGNADPVKDKLSDIATEESKTATAAKKAARDIENSFQGLPKWFYDLWEGIKKPFVDAWESIKKEFNTRLDNIKKDFNDFKDFVETGFKKPIEDIFGNLGAAIVYLVEGDFGKAVASAQRAINGLITVAESAINLVIRGFNQGLFGPFNQASADLYAATGGAVNLGQITGIPEVSLGRIQNIAAADEFMSKTAPAASKGIGGAEYVAGIRDSGKDAIFGGSQDMNVNVYLDGEQIANNSVKHINRSTVQNGKSPLLA